MELLLPKKKRNKRLYLKQTLSLFLEGEVAAKQPDDVCLLRYIVVYRIFGSIYESRRIQDGTAGSLESGR